MAKAFFFFQILVLLTPAVNSATIESQSDGSFVDSENNLEGSGTTYENVNIQLEILKKLDYLTEKVQKLEENLNFKNEAQRLTNSTVQEDVLINENISPSANNLTAMNEISSLVRWLVRKSFSIEQHQNNLFGGLLHVLKLNQINFVTEIKEIFNSGTNSIIEKSEEMQEKFSQLLNVNTEAIENAVDKISKLEHDTSSTENKDNRVHYSHSIQDGGRDNFLNANNLDVIKRVLNTINSSSSDYGGSLSSDIEGHERNSAEYLLSSPESVLTVFTVENERKLRNEDPESPHTELLNSTVPITHQSEINDEETGITEGPETNEVFSPDEFRSHYENNSQRRKDSHVGGPENEENKSELGLLLGKWKREFSVMLNAREANSDGQVEREVSSQLQEIQDSILGLKFYFDSGILKLRHQLEDIIVTSESALFSTISDTLSDTLSTSIKRKMVSSFAEIVNSAVIEARDTALEIADAAVTSVSSAAVASSQHSTDKLTRVIRLKTAEMKNLLSEMGGCPVLYSKVGDMCISLPTLAKKSLSDYHNASSLMTWPDAKAMCLENSGELLIIRNYRELLHLQKSLRQISLGRFWLGDEISLGNVSGDGILHDAKRLASNYNLKLESGGDDIEMNYIDESDPDTTNRWALFKDNDVLSSRHLSADEMLIPICQYFHSFFEN